MDSVAEVISRYEIRPSNESKLALRVFKKGLLAGERIVLHFEKFFGEVEYDQQQPERSKVEFVVESRSLTCNDKGLDSEQRKKVVSFALNKMLGADRYAEIKFSSTIITRQAINQYEVRGDLTIRGKTRPVVLHLATTLRAERLEVAGKAVIRMKDYGMEPPSDPLGFSGTKNKMKVRFRVHAEPATADARAGR